MDPLMPIKPALSTVYWMGSFNWCWSARCPWIRKLGPPPGQAIFLSRAFEFCLLQSSSFPLSVAGIPISYWMRWRIDLVVATGVLSLSMQSDAILCSCVFYYSVLLYSKTATDAILPVNWVPGTCPTDHPANYLVGYFDTWLGELDDVWDSLSWWTDRVKPHWHWKNCQLHRDWKMTDTIHLHWAETPSQSGIYKVPCQPHIQSKRQTDV